MNRHKDVETTCCTHCRPLKALWIGILYVIGIVALVFALLAWSNSSFAYSWTTVSVSQQLPMGDATSLIVATTPVTLTLPSILTNWIGRVYHVECISPLPHVIKTSGSHTWDGVNNRVICAAGANSTNAGFSFLVTGQLSVRVLDSNQVTFALGI